MATQNQHRLHFVLVPLMCPGHIIPMVDLARFIAQREVLVTIVTTPLNANRVRATIDSAVVLGLPIKLLELNFPAPEFGLPKNCENVDALPSVRLFRNFVQAAESLRKPLEEFLKDASTNPRPRCLISDKNLAWTAEVSRRLNIPRIVFDGTSCFTHLCTHNLQVSKVYQKVSDTETFLIPGMPDKIEFTRKQLSTTFNYASNSNMSDVRDQIRHSAEEAYGYVINTFQELETNYVREFKKIHGNDRVWCIGPVSLCTNNESDMAHRGNNVVSDDVNKSLKEWLDSKPKASVIYACLGSLNRVTPEQMRELGLGLEATNRPFIWVIRGANRGEELEKWLSEDGGFEERVRGRGLLIRGWASQVLILSSPAIGCFLTHCGWNSTIEGITAGVPMVTWPLFAEQFYNEKLVVQILETGVGVGAKEVVHLGEEDKIGVMVKMEDVKGAIEKVMDNGEMGMERRKRVCRLAQMAKEAVEFGGSSYLNITRLTDNISKTNLGCSTYW